MQNKVSHSAYTPTTCWRLNMRFRIYDKFKFKSTYQNRSNGRNDFFVVFLFWHRFVCLFIDILIDIFSMTSVRCFLFALELITKVPNDVLSILSSRLILDLDFFKDRDYVHSPKYVGASRKKKHAKNSSSTIPYGTFFCRQIPRQIPMQIPRGIPRNFSLCRRKPKITLSLWIISARSLLFRSNWLQIGEGSGWTWTYFLNEKTA